MIYYIVKIFGCDVFSSKNTVMLLINNIISSDAVRSGQKWGISTQSSCKQKWNLEVEQTNREGCSQIIYLLQLAVLTTRSWTSGVGICLVLHVLSINCMCSCMYFWLTVCAQSPVGTSSWSWPWYLSVFVIIHYHIEAETKWPNISQTTFSNAFSWMKIVPKGPISNIPALVPIMA